MDGLALFMSNTWDKIRTQKELNLPDQRVMVASLRCGELKEEALEMIAPRVNKLKQESDNELIAEFSQRCTNIIKDAVNHYDELGH
jgi:hypothetical protein